jgi:hypothetical protein
MTPVFSTSSRAGSGAGDRYEMPGHELAERLRAFASGQNVSSSAARSSIFPPGESGAADVQNGFRIAAPGRGGRDETLEEFSTKLADILREQALQHGIDIT